LNYALSGAQPAGFRITNIVIHSINSVLVLLIVFELGKATALAKKGRFQLALLAAALFATHPLLTESVTYIAGRSSSLCATF